MKAGIMGSLGDIVTLSLVVLALAIGVVVFIRRMPRAMRELEAQYPIVASFHAKSTLLYQALKELHGSRHTKHYARVQKRLQELVDAEIKKFSAFDTDEHACAKLADLLDTLRARGLTRYGITVTEPPGFGAAYHNFFTKR